jgi:hypothetical protein
LYDWVAGEAGEVTIPGSLALTLGGRDAELQQMPSRNAQAEVWLRLE